MTHLEEWVYSFLRDNYTGEGDFDVVYDVEQEVKDRIRDVKDGIMNVNTFVTWMEVDFDGAMDLWETIKEWEG